jgi:4-amino-4-deoxy-L-arabinose transferase-like glycosyltransferase
VSRSGLALFLFALAVRLAVIAALGADAAPPAWGDDGEYDRIATRLLNEHAYVNNWFPPGYPLFLALLYAVFGRSWVIVRVAQAIVGAATCVLLRQLGARLFSARAGALSGLILALYPGHAYMSWRLMGETVYSALLLCAILLAVDLLADPRPLPSVLLGVTLGAAQLVKSNLFAFAPLLMAWFALAAASTRRERLRCLSLMAGAAVVVMAMVPIANSLSAGGRAAALPGNAGRTLWWSNNPAADGYWIRAEATPQGQAFIAAHGLTERLASADEFHKDRICLRLALLWASENPGDFLVLCTRKLRNAFGLFPRALSLEESRLALLSQALSYALVAPFAAVGLLAAGARLRAAAPAYLALLSFVLMVLVFYGTPRFTLIVMPILILFAAPTLVSLFDSAHRLARRAMPLRLPSTSPGRPTVP